MAGTTTQPTGPLSAQLLETIDLWSRSQWQIIAAAAEFADSAEWVLAGSPTPAHWLAAVADIETATAREWVRIGRQLRELPTTADAFNSGRISYSKVRALTRIATAHNESELLQIALGTPASHLARALAAWIGQNTDPEDLDAHHQRSRSVKWRTEPDGMVTFTLRLPPLLAGALIAFLTTWVMTNRPKLTHSHLNASADAPTVAQQHADALEHLLDGGPGQMITEIILHVRGDGVALDDGTPITDSVTERIAPNSFLRAMIHDAQANPTDVSNRRRHPTARQKRLVKERDRACRDCGREDLLEYDHVPAFEQTGHTVTTELELRCAPCHHQRHAA